MFSKSESDSNASYGYHCGVGFLCLVISGSEPSILFHLVNRNLDGTSLLVHLFIERKWHLPLRMAGDNDLAAPTR